jgi:hypothetical protein
MAQFDALNKKNMFKDPREDPTWIWSDGMLAITVTHAITACDYGDSSRI